MELSLDNIAVIVGLLFMFGGLVGAWVETRLKVKTLMCESTQAAERYRECRKQLFSKQDEIIAGQAALRQTTTEVIGDLKTSIVRNAQKIDDLVEWLKQNGGKNA